MAAQDSPRARTRRVRTPTVLQMEATECGAASLAIILAHHKRIIPLELLREECGVSRDGAKASNVLAAARRFGFEAKGYRYELEDLETVPKPVVIFWKFNHFLVLEGYGKDRVYLNDPAEGPRWVTPEEFNKSYTGITLTFKPTAEFQPGGEQPSLMRTLGKRIAASRDGLVFALLAGVALVVPGMVIPTFTRVFVDKVLLAGMHTWVVPLLLGMGATALLRAALAFFQGSVLRRMGIKISTTTISTFFWHVLRLPMTFFGQRYSGEIANRVTYNLQVSQFLSNRLAGTAIDVLMLAAFLPLMISYDWLLTLTGLGAVAALALATAAVNRQRVDGNRRYLQEQGKATGALMGGLANIESVKATGGESNLFARWAGYQAKYMTARQQVDQVTQAFMVLPPLITDLTNAAVLGLGAWRVIQGGLTVGELVAFQSLMASFLGPVNRLVSLASELQSMEGLMNRLDDVSRYPVDGQVVESLVSRLDDVASQPLDPQVVEPDPDLPPMRIKGHLELRNITFGYSRLDAPLLRGFDLSLKPGSRVAVVGPTGCGKSTLLKLLTGLYEPWEGELLLDGAPRRHWPRSALAASVAAVDQDPLLFAGTLRDNLTLWDPTVSETVLVQACRDACIHYEIARRPGGYDSPVEEGGRNFSGGQLQRLEIARALVANPRILVLDEATSALDTLTEQLIDQNLRRRGCACVIVAHRLSTVRDAEEIIVLSRGEVMERGAHAELITQGGVYAGLAAES